MSRVRCHHVNSCYDVRHTLSRRFNVVSQLSNAVILRSVKTNIGFRVERAWLKNQLLFKHWIIWSAGHAEASGFRFIGKVYSLYISGPDLCWQTGRSQLFRNCWFSWEFPTWQSVVEFTQSEQRFCRRRRLACQRGQQRVVRADGKGYSISENVHRTVRIWHSYKTMEATWHVRTAQAGGGCVGCGERSIMACLERRSVFTECSRWCKSIQGYNLPSFVYLCLHYAFSRHPFYPVRLTNLRLCKWFLLKGPHSVFFGYLYLFEYHPV